MEGDWRNRAKCLTVASPELFFPSGETQRPRNVRLTNDALVEASDNSS
jgi:hypothetical protein